MAGRAYCRQDFEESEQHMTVPSVLTNRATTADRRIAYLLMRLTVGFSLFGHGLVRIPKLASFHAHLASEFTHSILPSMLVSLTGYALPFVEFGVGVMLVLGLLTKFGLMLGVLTMTILVFGSTTIESFSAIGDQLIHAAILTVLLVFLEYNAHSLDRILLRRGARTQSPTDQRP
jgi:thiosulfate dehydrogenase [quinone] large subunit